MTVQCRDAGPDRDRHDRGRAAKALERLRAAIPVRRIGRPDEVARVVGLLAADASGYTTGQAWAANGGIDM